MTKGSGDARLQPLFFFLLQLLVQIETLYVMKYIKSNRYYRRKKIDPTFYPVIYGIKDDDDWTDERNWYKANPL